MPRRILPIVIALLIQSLHHRPFPSFAIAEDVTADIHDQNAHLMPQNYAQGRRHYPDYDIERRKRKPPPKKRRPNNRTNRKKKKNKKKKGKPTKPNNKPNRQPGKKPPSGGGGGGGGGGSGSNAAAKKALATLSSVSSTIDNKLFLYEHPSDGWVPSTIYKFSGLKTALEVMNSQGVAGMYYYLGDSKNKDNSKEAHIYGLVNVAAFLAQSMKETIKYDACSENNWDLFGSKGYPLSNSCGQLGQSYQDYKCPKGEEHMECKVDDDMEITAVTHAKWYGAPAPFFCKPKKNKSDTTGRWDYGYECNKRWADPPETCGIYEDQKAGGFDNSQPVANRNGRTDVEGCCWWGRGVIQTTGICNFGKLNYYLGKRAADAGRKTPYGEIDFCKDPEIICSSKKYTELKWIAGMFYWMESVQKYDVGGWNYMDELHKFVDGGLMNRGFIDAVSGIVNRGCHNPPCGTGMVDGGSERYNNFNKALETFKLT